MRKSCGVAITALAHKLALVADLMLKHDAAPIRPPAADASEMPKGELRMLFERKLQPYVREIYQPSKTKAKAKPASGRPAGRPR